MDALLIFVSEGGNT